MLVNGAGRFQYTVDYSEVDVNRGPKLAPTHPNINLFV